MPLLVTSAFGANGNGYGALLAFDRNGTPLGAFCNDPRIADPRGLAVHEDARLLYLNSGQNRVLAIGADGTVVRDTGPIEGLNPGGGNFGPDGRYYVGLRSARTVMAFEPSLDAAGEHFLPTAVVPFPRGFAFSHDGRLILASGTGPNGVGDNALAAEPELAPLHFPMAENLGPLLENASPRSPSSMVRCFGNGNRVVVSTTRNFADRHGR
jgi:hypothetical protein